VVTNICWNVNVDFGYIISWNDDVDFDDVKMVVTL